MLDKEVRINKDDYFSLTDIAKYKNAIDPRFVTQNWMRRTDTIQYMGLWEQLNNPNLTVSNSTPLKVRPVIIISLCRLKKDRWG